MGCMEFKKRDSAVATAPPVATAVLTGGGFGAEKMRALGSKGRTGGRLGRIERSRGALCYRYPLQYLIYTGRKRRTPRGFLAGFCVNWTAKVFRSRVLGSAGRTRTYNQPVNSRLLYH